MDCVFVYMESDACDLTAQDVFLAGDSIARSGLRPYLYTNVPEVFEWRSNWEVVPMVYEYTGWWCMMELFRHRGPCISCQVDNLFFKSPDDLIRAILDFTDEDFAMWQTRKPVGLKAYGSMLMGWNGDFSWILDEFLKNPEKHMNNPKYTMGRNNLRYEQEFTADMLLSRGKNIHFVQKLQRGLFRWKTRYEPRRGHVADFDPETRVIVFTGNPRPSEAIREVSWLRDIVDV